MRFSRWFTGRGDDGTTDLLIGKRVKKSHPIVSALGAIDELSAALGCCRAKTKDESKYYDIFLNCQRELVSLMGALASQNSFSAKDYIEKTIEEISKETTMPNEFVIPGNNDLEATINLARTICRRAERSAVLAKADCGIITYLNRLSTLLFMLTIKFTDKGQNI